MWSNAFEWRKKTPTVSQNVIKVASCNEWICNIIVWTLCHSKGLIAPNPALLILQKFTLYLPWKFDRLETTWAWVNDDLRNTLTISLRILNATHNIYMMKRHEIQLSCFLGNGRIMKFLLVWIGDNKELRLSFEWEKERERSTDT